MVIPWAAGRPAKRSVTSSDRAACTSSTENGFLTDLSIALFVRSIRPPNMSALLVRLIRYLFDILNHV